MRLIYAQKAGPRVAAGKKKSNKRISYSLKRERRESKKKDEDKYVHKKSRVERVTIDDED